MTAAILLMYYHGDLNSGRTQSCGCIRSKGNQLILKELQKSDYILIKNIKSIIMIRFIFSILWFLIKIIELNVL